MGIFQSVSLSKLTYSLYPTLLWRKLRQRPLQVGKLSGYVYMFDHRTKMIIATIEPSYCHAVCFKFVTCFPFSNSNMYKYDSSFVVSSPNCRHILDVKSKDIAVRGTYFQLKENYLEPVQVFPAYELKEEDVTCVICLEKFPEIVMNCGHKCMCCECFNEYYFSKTNMNKTCPVCRVDIHSYMMVG